MDEEGSARWRRRKEARPGEILEAALDCFAERGYAATRLEDVAARAGVTKGTAYLYFKNKEELFRAVVGGYIVPALERIEAASRAPGPVSDILRRVGGIFVEKVLDSRFSAIPKLVIAEASHFPGLAQFYLDEVIGRGRPLLASLLRRGIDSGEFREVDVEHAVYCFLAPLLFSALWKHSLGPFDDRPLDAAALVRCHLDVFLRGLAPDESARARGRPAGRRAGKPDRPNRRGT